MSAGDRKTAVVDASHLSGRRRLTAESDLVSLRSHLFWPAQIPDRIGAGEEHRPMAAQRYKRTASTRTPRGDGDGVDARRLRVVVAKLEEETMLWQEFLRAHRTIIDEMTEQ